MVDPIDPGGSAIAAPAGRTTLRTIALRRDWHDAWRGVVLGLGLLTGSWLLLGASHHTVAGWERWLFRTVNDLPDPLRWILWLPMQLGSAWAWIVAFPVLALIYRRLAPGVAAALAGWSAHLIAQWAKATVDRARPEALLADVQVRTLGADGNGFPSGHAAVAAAIVTALVPWVGRRTRVTLWVLAGAVAFARVFFGVHLPLDVVGGAGIGLVCGSITTVLVGVPDRDR